MFNFCLMFVEVFDLVCELGLFEWMVRVVLGVGERFYVLAVLDIGYVELLEEVFVAFGLVDSLLWVWLLVCFVESYVFVDLLIQVIEFVEEVLGMVRWLVELIAFVAVLFGCYVVLLDVEYGAKRWWVGEEMLVVVGELEDPELGVFVCYWLLYDLVEFGDLE